MNRATTSASNLFRRALCPGSAKLEEGLPEEESLESREGQLLHDYAAHPEYDRRVLKPQQQDLLALGDELVAQVIQTVRPNLKDPTVVAEHREQQYHGIIPGRPDIVIEYPNDVLIIDRKFGYKVVERADLNLQLRSYAVIVVPTVKASTVYVAIVQPRLTYSEKITIAQYGRQEIDASVMEIKSILKDSERPGASLIAGDEQCRYCKAKLICPEFRKQMMFPAVLTPDQALSRRAKEAMLEQRLSEISDEDLEKVMVACRQAEFIKEPAFEEARKRIGAGKLDKFRLGNEYEVRSVQNVRRAIALLSLSGVTKEIIYDCIETLSLGKLNEKLRKTHNTWSENDANDYINKKLQSVIAMQKRKAKVLRK